MDNVRTRCYCGVWYPDCEDHALALDKLVNSGVPMACILHDKDVDDNGETKKPHWHLVFRYTNARWSFSVAKELGIDPNYLQDCANLDGALAYLVHYGHPDKYQYDSKEVFGSLTSRLEFLLRDQDESSRVQVIFEMIESAPDIVTYTEVFRKALANGLYADFRRMGSSVKFLIDEHNRDILNNLHDEYDELDAEVKRLRRVAYDRVFTY